MMVFKQEPGKCSNDCQLASDITVGSVHLLISKFSSSQNMLIKWTQQFSSIQLLPHRPTLKKKKQAYKNPIKSNPLCLLTSLTF